MEAAHRGRPHPSLECAELEVVLNCQLGEQLLQLRAGGGESLLGTLGGIPALLRCRHQGCGAVCCQHLARSSEGWKLVPNEPSEKQWGCGGTNADHNLSGPDLE